MPFLLCVHQSCSLALIYKKENFFHNLCSLVILCTIATHLLIPLFELSYKYWPTLGPAVLAKIDPNSMLVYKWEW